MSVNEVKIQKAEKEFEARGTGPPQSRTFAIGNEDHTLGNALRHVLMQNRAVTFAGYSVPHPSEPVVHIRIQTSPKTTAIDELMKACSTLNDQCEYVLEELERMLPETQQDRIRMEQLAMEEGYAEEELEENEDMQNVETLED